MTSIEILAFIALISARFVCKWRPRRRSDSDNGRTNKHERVPFLSGGDNALSSSGGMNRASARHKLRMRDDTSPVSTTSSDL